MRPHLAIEAVACARTPDWGVEPFRRVARERGVRNSDLAEQALSLSSAGLLYERNAETDRQSASEQSSRNAWVVHSGDLVVNPMWLFGGAIGVSDRRGAVSPDYRVYSLSPRLHTRYIHHLLRSSPYRDQYRLYMRAETTFDRRVTKDDFEEMPVFVPRLGVQRAISALLDAEIEYGDRLLAALRRRQELLRERRRTEVVDALRGPWPRAPLKRLAVANLRTLSEETTAEWKFKYIDISAVDSWGRIAPSEEMAFVEAPMRARRLADVGDVVISTVRTYLRAIAPVPPSDFPLVFSTGFAVLSPRPNVVPGFLRWAVQSDEFLDEVAARSVGINYPSINVDDLMDIEVVWPPFDRQEKIAGRLDILNKAMSAVLATQQRQIDLLLERRQGLIDTAVTGQLAIPEVAA